MILHTDVCLCLFLAVCSFSDWKTGKIPWYLTLSGLLWAAVKAGKGMLWGVGAGAICFPLFLFRMTGAADIKMIAVMVGILGPEKGSASVFAGLLLGAAWSLKKLLHQGILMKRLSYFSAYVRRFLITGQWEPYYVPERDGRQAAIPFACCLFLGTVICMAWKNGRVW